MFLFFARWIPPIAIVKHYGRVSGRKYRTPIMAFPTDGRFVLALTYGKDVDWVKNLLVFESGFLELKGSESLIHSFRFTSYEEVKEVFPVLVRLFLEVLSVNNCLIAESRPQIIDHT